jgi:hypothetical protein
MAKKTKNMPLGTIVILSLVFIIIIAVVYSFYSGVRAGANNRACTEALTYSRTDFKCYTSQLLNDWINSECTINNLDNKGGTFYVKIGFVIDGTDVTETQSAYLYPQTSYTFKKSLKASATSCYCAEISPLPTKEVC